MKIETNGGVVESRAAFRVGGDTARTVGSASLANGVVTINDTSTPAKAGDFYRGNTGALDEKEIAILTVSTNSFTIATTTLPATSDEFYIMRRATMRTDDTGALAATISTSGLATEAKQDTQITDLGGVTEAAPATDTASSGLNGRMQRIAQRLTSLIALIPASLGQKTGANSLAVVLASDQTLPLPSGAATEATLSTLNGKVTAVDTGAVVVASSALPSGASTAAKQPALGTAGTASADVITVQGIASMTALKVDGSAVTQPVSIATAPVLVAGSAIIGKVGIDQTTPGTTNGVQVNAALPAGSAVIGKVSIDQTTPGTTNLVALAANQSVNVAQINGVTALMGNGTTGTGSQRVTIASDNTAFTVNNQVITQSGSTNANSSLASTALEASHIIKGSAGRLFQLTGVNTKTSAQYIQVFNSTTVPSDTAAPVLLAYVQAGANFSWDFGAVGRYFSTGISVSNSSTAATKTIGSADCWFNAEYL
jgi:hypothetical protein